MIEEITNEQENAYRDYLCNHINAVNICHRLLTGISLEQHDESKCTTAEYVAYANYFYNKDGSKKQEHTDNERRAFDYAWLHHIHNNPHHWQYWVIPEDCVLEMPERYLMEMISDWGAFALINNNPNEIIEFWNKKRGHYIFHKDTESRVEQLVPLMAEKIAEYIAQ